MKRPIFVVMLLPLLSITALSVHAATKQGPTPSIFSRIGLHGWTTAPATEKRDGVPLLVVFNSAWPLDLPTPSRTASLETPTRTASLETPRSDAFVKWAGRPVSVHGRLGHKPVVAKRTVSRHAERPAAPDDGIFLGALY